MQHPGAKLGLKELENIIITRRPKIIAIDGELGAGKTTIATKLSCAHGYDCIHLDDFLLHEQEKFVDALRPDDLEAAINRINHPFIIEGVCPLQVLNTLGITPAIHIFLYSNQNSAQHKASAIVTEVDKYIKKTPSAKKYQHESMHYKKPRNQSA